MTPTKTDERRKMMLTPDDVSAIAEAIVSLQRCDCPVDMEEYREIVKFFRNMNNFLDGSKRTIWNAFLVICVATIAAIIGVGIWHKSGN